MEFASFIQFACERDCTAHEVDYFLYNGGSKAGSRRFLYQLPVVSCKSIPDFTLEFLGHSDSVILYYKMSPHILGAGRRFLLKHMNVNPSLLRGKLHRVGEQVYQNLIQTHAVAVNVFRHYIPDKDIEILLPALNLGLHNIYDIAHGFPQGNTVLVKRHFTAFNFGHIKHVVNERQKMFAGKQYLFQAILCFRHVSHILQGNFRHSDNRVHRRSYIVAHAGKEIAFRLIRLHGHPPGLVNLLHLLPRQGKITQKNNKHYK